MQDIFLQHGFERLAREAAKIHGIALALEIALTEVRGVDAKSMSGALLSIEDTAKSLTEDLEALAEACTEEAHHESD